MRLPFLYVWRQGNYQPKLKRFRCLACDKTMFEYGEDDLPLVIPGEAPAGLNRRTIVLQCNKSMYQVFGGSKKCKARYYIVI